MVRYPLKRPLSVELDVAIHLSSTFQRAFFHSSKHFLILDWWMRKRWSHLGCLFEVVRTFFGKYDLRLVSGHCLRKLLLYLDFGLSIGIQVADTSPPVKTIAVYLSPKWRRMLSLLRINGISQTIGFLLNQQQQPNFSFIVMDGSSTLQLMYIVQP